MSLVSKSLHHSNAVFVFDPKNFTAPDNSEFAGLYSGQAAIGARFVEDPLIGVKALFLPQLKIEAVVEKNKLRVDDQSQEEPEKTNFLKEAAAIYGKLFKEQPLVGFGFNYDIYFKFNNVISTNVFFEDFFGEGPLKSFDLRDFGFQFTLENPKEKFLDTWFLKVVAPLEVAAHLNRHFNSHTLPAAEKMKELFKSAYDKSDELLKNLA